MLYQDFDLLIDRSGDSLRAQVLNSPAGQASAEFCLPFSEDKLENYLLRLGRTHAVATRRVESQEMNTAKAFGAALFDAVFTGDVKACFRSSIDEVRRQNAGLRIRLRLADPSVADLPWEFLYNRSVNRFIALSIHTPLVRYMDLPERIQPIAVKPPIRVLVMISSPSDFPPLDVEAEWTQLNESLADRIAAGQIAIERLAGASLESLQHRLRRESYHIFHFIGHGEFDQALQEGVLILESENKRGHKVDSQFLGMLLHDHESLRVAILNACEGARTSRTDPFAGSAQSLVQQGIPAVIAMQFEIANDVAGRFAHEFYGALADGYPIDASLTEARKSIFAAGREVEWGTPVLYLRAPDGRIFDIDSSAPPARADVPTIPKVAGGPARADRDGFAPVVVAAAQAAFAGGQRVEAIEMLRRYDPSQGGIGEALRELTLQHERLTAEAQQATSEKLEEHMKVAGELLANGKVSDAWAHACDALRLDSTDKRAVALEARVRKALEAQAARDFAREQEGARLAQEARAREIERASALTEAAAHRERLAEQVIEQDPRPEPSREPAPSEPVASIMGRPRVLWAAAVVLIVAAAALWLVPLALNRSTPPNGAPARATDVAAQKQPNPTPSASPATPAAPVSAAPAPPETATVPPETAAAEPEPRAAPPGPSAGPTAATAGTVPPTPAAVPNETTIANFRKHVQTLLSQKDAERALSVLTEGLAYAPADKGLLALGPKVLDQARARASQERSKAVAQRASGRTKFKQAERAMQRAQTLARERKTEASARTYFDAAEMFASAAAGTAAGGAARAEEEVTVPEAAEPEPPPAAPAAKPDPTPPPPKPTLAIVDPVIDGFASAMSRGDRGALLAVYPNPPAEVLAALGKRPRGYNMRIDNRFMASDSRGRPEVVLSVVHESLTPSGAREEKSQRIVLTLDYVEKSWQIVASR
jgi:CHAT domain